jgi:membrane fusion protein, multidrug efflux system
MRLIRTLTLVALTMMALHARADVSSVAVRTAVAEQRSVGAVITLYGRVQPDPAAVLTLSLPHAGLVTRVAARLGQRVSRGDPLLELSTAPAVRMQFVQARSAVDYAERELRRQQRLLKEQLATTAQVDGARKALADARSSLQAMEAQSAGQSIETLHAPMDGIVTALNVRQGERVQADTAALAIAGDRHLIAVLGIEPEDLAGLRVDAPVRLRSVFDAGLMVDSRLTDIHAMVDPQTGLVQVLAPIPEDAAGHFVIGSYLRAEVERKRHPGVTVPRSAVLQDATGSFVFRVADGKAERTPVQTGLERDGWVEVTGGLTPGEAVVISGNYELTDGMAVREAR